MARAGVFSGQAEWKLDLGEPVVGHPVHLGSLVWLARKAAQTSASPARRAAPDLVNEAVKFVTQGQEKATDISRHVQPYTPDYRRWMEYRPQLIQVQLRLTN